MEELVFFWAGIFAFIAVVCWLGAFVSDAWAPSTREVYQTLMPIALGLSATLAIAGLCGHSPRCKKTARFLALLLLPFAPIGPLLALGLRDLAGMWFYLAAAVSAGIAAYAANRSSY